MQNMALRLTKSNSAYDNNSGAFMGFDTSCEDSETSDVEKGANTGKALDEVTHLTYLCRINQSSFRFRNR